MTRNEPAPRLRRALDGIPTYRPGRPAAPRDGAPAYKLVVEREPLPAAAVGARSGARGAAESFNRYPDMFATGLIAAIAEPVRRAG